MRKKHWAWLLLAAPAILLLYRFATDAISYGQMIHRSGQWSVALLIAALSVTPLQRAIGTTDWIRLLRLERRAIGVASFAYAALHTGVYLERKWGADLIVTEGLEPSLGAGWFALLVLLILALTSNGASVRALGARWKTLHRAVYVGAALTFAHWILATFDPVWAYTCLALILIIEALRLRDRGYEDSSH
jgi:sulfoxide reductase heme-binding subunit YedZ